MSSKVKSSVSVKAGSHASKQTVKSATEPHRCTGKFKDDFENICTIKNLKYVPDVIARSKRPGSAIQNMILNQQSETYIGKTDKKLSNNPKSKTTTTTIEVEHETEINIDSIDLPPKSFVVKEPIEYFKPKIHVEMDNPDKLDTVTEIHIKGWKLEKPIIEVLNICLPAIDQLHTLNLWNSGLDEEAVRLISSMLPNCPNLKTLILDSNPIRNPVYQVLLFEENSNVQNLSLRNNQLDDLAVQSISFGLGTIRRQNTKLLTLNLNSNLISDYGAISLAKALRTNRTLLVLNLANNNIGDEGAKAFADVISKFQLTPDEIVHRRYVMSGRNFEKSVSPVGRKQNESKERPNSQKGSTHNSLNETKSKKDKTKKSTDAASIQAAGNASTGSGTLKNTKETISKTKKDDKNKKEKSQRESSSMGESKANKSQKLVSKSGKKPTKDTDEVNDSEEFNGTSTSNRMKNAALLELSSLTDHAEYVNDGLWLIGNRTILSLNLSRNQLTDQSINYFLLALQYQRTFMDLHRSQGTGLLRLLLTNNKLSSNAEVSLNRLNELLKQKDPLIKAVSNNNQNSHGDLDTASIQSGKESSLGRNTNKTSKH